MLVQSSNILMTSQHLAVKEQTKSESLRLWIGDRRPDFEGAEAGRPQPARDRVDLSPQSRNPAQLHDNSNQPVRSRRKEDAEEQSDPMSRFVSILMELLTGKKIKLKSVEPQGEPVDPQKAAELSAAAQQPQQPARAGFGLEYDSRETYLEAESLSFSAKGVVRTADGKQIDFTLDLSLQRVFYSEQSTSLRLGDAVLQQDPLVINFNGSAAQLTSTKFSFDLDTDGSDEQISFVGPNSGFIALDKNGDGRVNNGSELFGTASGNGFNDLAAYDHDRNGWIDDNDPVFSQLKVWMKDAEGKDSLTGLKIMGVGALYLGDINTQFDFKTAGNESLGTLRASSVYLNENGSVGTLQDVDLTV
jgi:hypothetical protein